MINAIVRQSAGPVCRLHAISLAATLVVALPLGFAHAQGFSRKSVGVSTDSTRSAPILADSLFGRSGKLRFRTVTNSRPLAIPILERLFGEEIRENPGIYALGDSSGRRTFSLISLLPFARKEGSHVGGYRVGFWPAEKREPRSDAYLNPDGFITVTEENQDLKVSEHFRLRDFLTHDQENVWPKYLVLREELIDKLELVMDDLEAHGHPVRHVRVMSGFRTPSYNLLGVGPRRGGRALDSRHQFGDAADIMIDNNGDGRQDDLNGDGKSNSRDIKVILDAVDRVERAYPELVGGAGLYRAGRQHGPFAHIDVRGNRARWTRG